VHRALVSTGPPIIAAGLTTAAGFVSFAVMDIEPMREFGVLMSVATLIIIVLTLLFVPAALVLAPLRARPEGRAPTWALDAMKRGASAIASHRAISLGVVLAIVGVGSYLARTVRAHTDINSLFAADSEPVRADNFLQSRFGGSLFLQVEVTGDIKHPAVLHQIDRIASAAGTLDGISDTQAISAIIRLAAGASTGEMRIPPSPITVGAVGELVATEPSSQLLVDDRWAHSLLQLRLAGFDISRAKEIAATFEEKTAPLLGTRVTVTRAALTDEARAVERDEILTHIEWIIKAETGQQVAVDDLRG